MISIQFLLPLAAGMFFCFFALDRAWARNISLALGTIQVSSALALSRLVVWSDPSQKLLCNWLLFRWSSLWNSHFSLAASTLNVPFLVLTALAFIVIYFCLDKDKVLRQRLAALFFLQAALQGAYLSDSLFAFVFFSATLALPTTFLIGLDSTLRRSWGIQKFLAVEVIASLVGAVALIGIQSLNTSDDIADWFKLQSGEYETDARTLLFFLLCFSFLLRTAIYPFCASKKDWSAAKPVAVLLPVLSIGSVGLYGIFRFVLEQFPGEWLQYGEVLGILGFASALWAALRLWMSPSYRDNLTRYAALYHGLVLLGVSSSQHWGVLGAWTLLFYSGFALTAYGVLLVFGESRDCEPGPAYAATNPLVGMSYALCIAAVNGLPISVGFYCLVFIFWGTALAHNALFCLSLLILPPLLIALSKNLVPSGDTTKSADAWNKQAWSRFEYGLYFPMLLLLLMSGIAPNWIIKSALPAVGYFLKVLGRV